MARERVPSPVTLPPFQHLLDAHGRDVHRFLVATVGHHDAEDCYQETWLTALRAYPRLRDASNLRSWIMTVAYHKAIDQVRSKRRRAVPVGDLPDTALAVDSPPSLLSESTTSAVESTSRSSESPPSPESDGTFSRSSDDLWELVRALPPKQRTALALRFVGDAAYGEISSVMGTSEEAARRNVHEGLKRLRTEYQR
jgi:RNA polymerase sigma factor (sigma-70 family)